MLLSVPVSTVQTGYNKKSFAAPKVNHNCTNSCDRLQALTHVCCSALSLQPVITVPTIAAAAYVSGNSDIFPGGPSKSCHGN